MDQHEDEHKQDNNVGIKEPKDDDIKNDNSGKKKKIIIIVAVVVIVIVGAIIGRVIYTNHMGDKYYASAEKYFAAGKYHDSYNDYKTALNYIGETSDKYKSAVKKKDRAYAYYKYEDGMASLKDKDYASADDSLEDAINKCPENDAKYAAIKSAYNIAEIEYESYNNYSGMKDEYDSALTSYNYAAEGESLSEMESDLESAQSDILDIKTNYTGVSKKSDVYNKAKSLMGKANVLSSKVKSMLSTTKAKIKAKKAAAEAKINPKVLVNSNGKTLIRFYMDDYGTFSFSGKYTGTGNFIVQVLDSNQQLEELLVNEIGDYVVDTSCELDAGYHYLQVENTYGSCHYSYSGMHNTK